MIERHIVLDIETLGNGSNAAIMSIGAVELCAKTGEVGEGFSKNIDPYDAVKHGEMDMSTVLWWLKQSDAARKETFEREDNVPLSVALGCLGAFINDKEVFGVWGNGATFDNVILHNAAKAVGIPPLWNFRLDYDMRTLKYLDKTLDLFTIDPPSEGVAHAALDDAIWQAKKIGLILCCLRSYTLTSTAWRLSDDR
jgi:hypothetical protein